MKKLTTLKKELANITAEELAEIINCENVNAEELTDREKLAVLCYRELAGDIDNTTRTLTLDCNYENSNFHRINKKHPDESYFDYKVDFMSVLSNDSKHDRLVALYFKATKTDVFYRICISGKKSVVNRFADSDLPFEIKSAHELTGVRFDDAGKVIKSILAILAEDAK